MSFRIEEKLYIKSEHLIDFKQFLIKLSAKQLYQPRLIKSLYFDSAKKDQSSGRLDVNDLLQRNKEKEKAEKHLNRVIVLSATAVALFVVVIVSYF